MKKVFVLFGLLFAVCLAVCFIGPLPVSALEQTNQRAQPDTQVRVTHPRRRHRQDGWPPRPAGGRQGRSPQQARDEQSCRQDKGRREAQAVDCCPRT